MLCTIRTVFGRASDGQVISIHLWPAFCTEESVSKCNLACSEYIAIPSVEV